MHVAALNYRDLKWADRQDGMTDNSSIITHHIDAWEKSEPRSLWCGSKSIIHGLLGPGPFQQPRFPSDKGCWLMNCAFFCLKLPGLKSARLDSCTSSSWPRSDCPHQRVPCCGKFLMAVRIEKKSIKWTWVDTELEEGFSGESSVLGLTAARLAPVIKIRVDCQTEPNSSCSRL